MLQTIKESSKAYFPAGNKKEQKVWGAYCHLNIHHFECDQNSMVWYIIDSVGKYPSNLFFHIHHAWILQESSQVSPWFLRVKLCRVVIKSRGPGIFPGYWESGPRLLLLENRRKIEPKEIPSRLIPRLLVVFTRQLEILVTTLLWLANNVLRNRNCLVA